MNHYFPIVVACFCCVALPLVASLKDLQKQLYSMSAKEELLPPHHYAWMHDLNEGQKIAQENDKLLLVAFVGLPWCPWSEKMQRDVLSDEKFIQQVQEKFVLVSHLLKEEGNDPLKERFSISELPTLLILDSSGQEVSRVGYLPKTADLFASYLLQLLNDFREVEQYGKQENLATLSSEELKQLYLKAKNQGFHKLEEKLYLAGLNIDDGLFFLLEKYRRFSERGKQGMKEAVAVKKKILALDPKNEKGAFRSLALFDFQALATKRSKKKKHIKAALAPLVAYVKKFGKEDLENLWRMEMLIAQFLYRKNKASDALLHAKSAYNHAPEENKGEIVDTISYLETKVKKNG